MNISIGYLEMDFGRRGILLQAEHPKAPNSHNSLRHVIFVGRTAIGLLQRNGERVYRAAPQTAKRCSCCRAACDSDGQRDGKVSRMFVFLSVFSVSSWATKMVTRERRLFGSTPSPARHSKIFSCCNITKVCALYSLLLLQGQQKRRTFF
jgi:hypothetical protein